MAKLDASTGPRRARSGEPMPADAGATAPRRSAGRSAVDRPALPAIVLLGLALRLFRLGHQPIWLDEAYTWLSIDVLRSSGLSGLAMFDHIGPGYYLVANLFWALGLHNAWGLRIGSALAGTVAIWLGYTLVHEITGRRDVALGAAGFLAVSPMAVWYGQEARGYSLLLALGAWYLLLVWRQVHAPTRARLAWMALDVALLMWVHQFAVFLFAAMFFFVVIRVRRLRPVLEMVAAHLVGMAAFVPWLVLSWQRLTEQTAVGKQTILTRVPYNMLTMIAGQTYGPSNLEIRQDGIASAVKANLPAFALFGLAMVLLLVGLWRARGEFGRTQLVWIACMFVLPNIGLVASSVVTHTLYHARYLISLLPMFGWLFGILVVRSRRDVIALGAVVSLVVVMVWSLVGWYFQPKYGKEDYSQTPGVLNAEVGPGDAVLLGNRLAIPSMWQYGFRCAPDHANVLSAEALQTLGTLPIDHTAGHDTFTVETRQWETVPSWQLDSRLDQLLGKPVRTWTWNGVTLTQRHGALKLAEGPGMDTHCDNR